MPDKYTWQKVGVFVFTMFIRATKWIITKDLFTGLCVEVVFVQNRFVLGEIGLKRYHKIIPGFTLGKYQSFRIALLQNSVWKRSYCLFLLVKLLQGYIWIHLKEVSMQYLFKLQWDLNRI